MNLATTISVDDRAADRQALTAAPRRGERTGSSALRAAAGRMPIWVWVLVLYAAVAIVTIGRYAIAHMGSVSASVGTGDPAAYMWAMSWWPYAIAHGLNPFVTHYLWAPIGVNTAQATLIPTASLLMFPFTALFGPIFSYNLLAILSCALSAFTAYLLCRRLCKRELPAVAGGYLFGFSSYQFGQLTGHMNLTLILLLPVMVHLALRRFGRELSRGAYVVAMALLLIMQAGLSTELLAEGVGLGAVVLVCLRFMEQPRRARVDGLILETIGAGLLAFAAGFPFFYYALFSGEFPKGVGPYWDVYAQDLLNTIFPTIATWVGHNDFKALSETYTGGGVTGDDGYLSVALVIGFLAWVLGAERRRSLTKVVLIVAVLSFVASLGAHLHVAGVQTITLPFDLVKNVPIFNDLLPSRIAVFTSLAVSIGIAMWLAHPSGRVIARWLVVVAGAILIFPNVTSSLYGVSPRNPIFFSTRLYKQYLTPGETVLVLPYDNNDVSTLWQAEAGFSYYMPEGYVSQIVPPYFFGQPIVASLLRNVAPPSAELGSFIRQQRVSHVVVDPVNAGPWPALLAQLGLHGRPVGGVILYPVRGSPAHPRG